MDVLVLMKLRETSSLDLAGVQSMDGGNTVRFTATPRVGLGCTLVVVYHTFKPVVPAEKSVLVGTFELAGSDGLGSLRDDIHADFAAADAPRPGEIPNRA